MTLPSSGAISLSQVDTELGRASNANVSLGETATRNLAGVASGAISMSNLYGKSASVTFSPVSGSYTQEGVGQQTYTITASASVTWTYSKTSGTAGSANIASGAAATSITFTLASGTAGHATTWSVSASPGGGSWTIQLLADISGGTGCVTIDSLVLMADGTCKPAGDIKVGDWVWTKHEHTRKWDAFRVADISFADDDVYSVPGHPLTTYRHRFALPFKGWWRTGWLGRKAGHDTIAKITVEGAHTYMAKRPGSWWWRLCHNIKQ